MSDDWKTRPDYHGMILFHASGDIPEMTDPYGKHWSQPDRKFIEVDDRFAKMSEESFNKLPVYDTTIPTGIYDGKMWAMRIPKTLVREKTVYLCWYAHALKEPEKNCRIERREIVIVGKTDLDFLLKL